MSNDKLLRPAMYVCVFGGFFGYTHGRGGGCKGQGNAQGRVCNGKKQWKKLVWNFTLILTLTLLCNYCYYYYYLPLST